MTGPDLVLLGLLGVVGVLVLSGSPRVYAAAYTAGIVLALCWLAGAALQAATYQVWP